MSRAELMNPPIRVKCPVCPAEPGEDCTIPSGPPYPGGPHRARQDLYFDFSSRKGKPGYYAMARNLIEDLGGRMEWEPGGGGAAGAWRIELHGKTHRVPVIGLEINDLDELYVPEVDEPRFSLDHGSPGTLQPDAFWRLVDLFRE